jgi:hypothetical protein
MSKVPTSHVWNAGFMRTSALCLALAGGFSGTVSNAKSAPVPTSATSDRLTKTDFDLARHKNLMRDVAEARKERSTGQSAEPDLGQGAQQGLTVKPALGTYRLPASRYPGQPNTNVVGVRAKLPLGN